MNGQQIIALTTGLGYLAAAFIAVPAIKLMGKTYRTHATVHWGGILIGVAWVMILFFRGVTILYPGEAVAISSMSWIAPTVPIGLCVVHTYILDFIHRHRDPPPLFERIIRTFLMRSPDDDRAAVLGMALPAAAVGDVPADEPLKEEEGGIGRVVRLVVLVAGAAALAAIVFTIVASSPVTAAIVA